jgi:uncharacterized protein HemY
VGALNNLAYLLTENTGQPDEALKYAEQAKEIVPANPEVDDTLGWIYYRKGIYLTAVKYLESATAKSSTAVRRYHLAMAYLKAGDVKRGQQRWKRLSRAIPSFLKRRRLCNSSPRRKKD